MAITLVEALPQEWSGAKNRLWQRTYKRKWRVETDSRLDGPVTLLTATTGSPPVPLFPLIGNSYFVTSTEKDLGSFVTDVNIDFEDLTPAPGLAWLVTVSYGPYDASVFGPNPVDWPLLMSFGAANYEKIVTIDQAGNPILNSAGDPFQDPVMIDDSRSIITVKRNELVSTFDLTLAEAYRDKVNSAPWNGFGTKTVKCKSITTGEQSYDSNAQVCYFAVTYVFEIERLAWTKHLLDQGYNYLDTSTPPKKKAVQTSGQKTEEPELLDASGHLLGAGTPNFLDFDVYPAVDFAAFSIDLSTAWGR